MGNFYSLCPTSPRNIPDRHLAVLENQLGGGTGPDTEFVLPLLSDGESGHAGLYNKRGDTFVAVFGIHSGEDDENAGFFSVGNPQFVPVEHPAVAFFFRRAVSGRRHRCPSAASDKA